MATGSAPPASSIWRHLPLPAVPVLSRPALLAVDDSRLNGARTHMATLNASVEALSSTLTSTTAELGEAKREVRALADLQTEALQNVTGEVTRLANRSQTAILDCLGAPAQEKDIHELMSLARINAAKLDVLNARVSTVDSTVRTLQTRFDTFERQLGDISTVRNGINLRILMSLSVPKSPRMLSDQQSNSIMQLTSLLQSVLTQSLMQSSPLPPAPRKRPRDISDIDLSSSPLGRSRIRPSSGGKDGQHGPTDVQATPSSFVPREVMPGSFLKPSRPVPRVNSPHQPSLEIENPSMATAGGLNQLSSDSSHLSSVSKLVSVASYSDFSCARPSAHTIQQLTTSPRTPTTMTTGTDIRTSPGWLRNLNHDADLKPEPVAPSDWLDFDDLDSDDTEQ